MALDFNIDFDNAEQKKLTKLQKVKEGLEALWILVSHYSAKLFWGTVSLLRKAVNFFGGLLSRLWHGNKAPEQAKTKEVFAYDGLVSTNPHGDDEGYNPDKRAMQRMEDTFRIVQENLSVDGFNIATTVGDDSEVDEEFAINEDEVEECPNLLGKPALIPYFIGTPIEEEGSVIKFPPIPSKNKSRVIKDRGCNGHGNFCSIM